MKHTNLPVLKQGVFDSMKEERALEALWEMAGDLLAEATVEREGKLVRNVALLGPVSRNGYRYTTEAMRLAAPLYEGRPVFVDHPEPPQARSPGGQAWPHRSLRDYAGRVVAARFEGERIRGDLQLLGPNADWLLPLLEAAPSDIGMSHVVLARRNKAGDQVEHIDRVVSVDIVAFPATTQSFEEATGGVARPERSDGRGGSALDPATPFEDSGRATDPGVGLEHLIEASLLPPAARTATLPHLIEAVTEPRRFLGLLDQYLREVGSAGLSRNYEPLVGSAGLSRNYDPLVCRAGLSRS